MRPNVLWLCSTCAKDCQRIPYIDRRQGKPFRLPLSCLDVLEKLIGLQCPYYLIKYFTTETIKATKQVPNIDR